MKATLPPAPRWAWVGMLSGIAAIAVMIPAIVDHGRVAVSASSSERAASSAVASPAGTSQIDPPTEEQPVVAVYGDAYSAGTAGGGQAAAGWPALLADRLNVDVRLHASPGAGYVIEGATFLEQVGGSPEPDADVVVIFGSRNDTGAPAQVITDRARSTYEAVEIASPDASLVVVGPAWSDEAVPSDTFLARDGVRTAAEAAGAVFVDPLSEGWFFGRLDLIAVDAINPTDQGHTYLADRMEPVLEAALRRGRVPA